ncbi:MAG: D-Ala-D-Ala carboxypeptidase family metallohydrolase [Bacteroidota bacterium]
MSKVSKDFDIREFVPKPVYAIYGDISIWFVDHRIILFCQWLRDYLKKSITINNWHLGGQYNESCFRLPDTMTGAKLSQHRHGRAADVKVSGYDPEEVRGIIRKNFDLVSVNYGISVIEKDTPTWTHADCRFTGLSKLMEVNG